MLGIIIGVGAVIAMVAIGAGRRRRDPAPDRRAWAPTSSSSARQPRQPAACAPAPAASPPSPPKTRSHPARVSPVVAAVPPSVSGAPMVVRQSELEHTAPGRGAGLSCTSATARVRQRPVSSPTPTASAPPGSRHRPDRRATSCSAPTTRSARRSASRNLPFRVVGVLSAKGQTRASAGPGRHRHDPLHDRMKKPAVASPIMQTAYPSCGGQRRAATTAQAADHRAAAPAPPHRSRAARTTSTCAT